MYSLFIADLKQKIIYKHKYICSEVIQNIEYFENQFWLMLLRRREQAHSPELIQSSVKSHCVNV